MIKHSNRNDDLCLLILIPANDAARKYCNQTDSSLICQIQMDSDSIQKGLIYQQQQPRMYDGNKNVDLRKFQDEIRNNNSYIPETKTSLSLLNSFKNLTIEKRQEKLSRDSIKQRRVKINKKFLSIDTNKQHIFSLWYNNKKKEYSR